MQAWSGCVITKASGPSGWMRLKHSYNPNPPPTANPSPKRAASDKPSPRASFQMQQVNPMSDYGVITESNTLRFERLLPGPIDRVWRYLIDSDKRGQWLAYGEIEPR